MCEPEIRTWKDRLRVECAFQDLANPTVRITLSNANYSHQGLFKCEVEDINGQIYRESLALSVYGMHAYSRLFFIHSYFS